MTLRVVAPLVAVLITGGILSLGAPVAWAQDQPKTQWNVPPGMRLVEDAAGFVAPVGIAFLNNPGPGPKDPLYLVTELRGAIKVVSRDRTVSVFADDTGTYRPRGKPLPHVAAQIGQTGICITADDSAVFTTGVIAVGNTRINRITRWESTGSPRWRRGRPSAELVDLFRGDEASNPHQIGNCFIGKDGKLWVGTGDGAHHRTAHIITHTNGKLLRMNTDFSAARDNPFYDPANPGGVESYVYASGLRNPFAIAEAEPGRVYIADNGPQVDRLIAVEPGRDYPWDGTNQSMTYNNLLTWTRSIGPAAMLHVKRFRPIAGLDDSLLVTASFRTLLIRIPVHKEFGVTGPPEVLVSRNDPTPQVFTGVALGPDGVYIAHMRIGERGAIPSGILKLVPGGPSGPSAGKPRPLDGRDVFQSVGCQGCHKLGGQGGISGPSLDNVVNRLRGRLESQAYRDGLARLDKVTDPRRGEFTAALARLREGRGDVDDRVRLWLRSRLSYPKFDDPQAAMPAPELDEAQIEAVTAFLMQAGDISLRQDITEEALGERIKGYFMQRLDQYFVVIFVLGIGVGFFFRGFWRMLRWPFRRGRTPPGND